MLKFVSIFSLHTELAGILTGVLSFLEWENWDAERQSDFPVATEESVAHFQYIVSGLSH